MSDERETGDREGSGAMSGELAPAEAAALRALRSGPSVPAEMEDRVVAALHDEGLLAGGSRSRAPRARPERLAAWIGAGLAASLSAFAVGWWVRGAVPVAAPSGDAYVLLLHDTGVALPAAEEGRLVAEYGAWAADLRRRGVDIDGEKLEDSRTLLDAGRSRVDPGPSRGALAGYFVVRAASPEAALAVAEGCPHLRHGGSVELRRIAVLDRE
jgi:hypothetical protein